jgi:parallel beta-helix repeat protein
LRRRVVARLTLTLFLLNIFTLTFNFPQVLPQSATITVPGDYATIQGAINAADPGDTILVQHGTYYEHLTIDKSLTITGEDRDITIIDGSLNGTAVRIDADNVQIKEFTIRNGYEGIYILNSDGNTVSQSNITLNVFEGLVIENSANNLITSNLISFNGWDGVYMFSARNTTLQSNIITTNKWTGVYLEYSYDNNVSGNSLSSNTKSGIRLDDSDRISVVGNNISWNELDGINFFNITNSLFYHNNILNNTEQVSSDDSPNAWDNGYPSGGNFWGDPNYADFYSGQAQDETGSDGLADTPQPVDSASQDNYPLMGPIFFFNAGIWDSTSWSVGVFSNSTTVSKFQLDKVEKTMSFNVTGENTLGFCRVSIPNIIVQYMWQDGYEILVDEEDPLMMNNWLDETRTYVYFTYPHSEHEITIQALDQTPPFVSILSPENRAYPAEEVSLIFALNDDVSWIGYSLDNQMNVTIGDNATLVDLSDGTHTIVVYANDTAGNMGYSDTVYFIIDTISPNIEILSPENRTYATADIPLNLTIDELSTWMAYSLDSQANVTVTGNTTLSGLSDGPHSLTAYANDTVGNTGASETVYFNINAPQTEPVLSLEWIILLVAAVGIGGTTGFILYRKRRASPAAGTSSKIVNLIY